MRGAALSLALSLGLAVGCTPRIPDATFVCTTSSECPPGLTCASGVCRAGAFDVGPLPDAGLDASMLVDAALDGGPDASAALDGGADAAGLDAGPDADLVVVHGETVYRQSSGDTRVPIAFDPSLALRVQTGPTTLSADITPMNVGADARAFAGVPSGATYYLQTSPTTYRITTAREVDLSRYAMGRPNVPQAAADATQITFDVIAMDAWQTGDVIELVATDPNVYVYLTEGDVPAPPMVGDVALNGYGVPWRTYPLVDASMGDRMRMFHLTTVTTAGVTAQVCREQIQFTPFSLADAASIVLMGSFTNLPTNVTTTVSHWRTTAFEALRTSVGPGVTSAPGQHTLDFQAQPLRPEHREPFSGTLDLFVVQSDGSADVSLGSLSFANPYASSDLLRGVQAVFATSYVVPGATPTVVGWPAAPMVTVVEEQGAGWSPTLVPMVLPPSRIRVGSTILDDAGTYPDVSIDAPVVVGFDAPVGSPMTPTLYNVRLFEGYAASGGVTRRVGTATFVIETGTSFVIPPGILQRDKYYYLLVDAQAADPAGPVVRATASATSSFFHTI